jgi:hypothetical protein
VSGTKSTPAIKAKPATYNGFLGLDTSRDKRFMESGQGQHLTRLENGYCDFRGQIVRDPPATARSGTSPVAHAVFFSPDLVAWVERRAGGLSFNSDFGHTQSPGWPVNAIPSSTVFNRRVQMFCRGFAPFNYDGVVWRRTTSPSLSTLAPAFGTAVQRRMAIAGILGKETEVHISRVDNDAVFPSDEPPNSNNVLRAGMIDVANILGASEQITGLSPFEQSNLVIFTSDRALIYQLDPDITKWAIIPGATVQVGCVSHNSIVQAGTDVIYCGRGGIYSIRRNQDNGITVFSLPMSLKIQLLYRSLLRSVPDQRLITAVWDQDNAQYHVFFPQPDNAICTRLTMTFAVDEEELGNGRTVALPQWSTGTSFNARCGASLAGRLVFGTYGGVWDVENLGDEGVDPTMVVETPILWHGDLENQKESNSLVLQASGSGTIQIEAFNDVGQSLGGMTVEVSKRDDADAFPDLPLERQYVLPFQRRYRGLQLRFTCTGKGLLRIVGFAVVLRSQ